MWWIVTLLVAIFSPLVATAQDLPLPTTAYHFADKILIDRAGQHYSTPLAHIMDSEIVGDHIITVSQSNGQKVLSVNDAPLISRYRIIKTLGIGSEVTLRQDYILSTEQSANGTAVSIIDKNLRESTILLPDPKALALAYDGYVALSYNQDGQTKIEIVANKSRDLKLSATCNLVTTISKPGLGLRCDDSLYLYRDGNFTRVEGIGSSLTANYSPIWAIFNNQNHLIAINQTNIYSLDLSQIDQVKVIGPRIFYRAQNSWQELDVVTGQSIPTPIDMSAVLSSGGGAVILADGLHLSLSYGQWSTLVSGEPMTELNDADQYVVARAASNYIYRYSKTDASMVKLKPPTGTLIDLNYQSNQYLAYVSRNYSSGPSYYFYRYDVTTNSWILIDDQGICTGTIQDIRQGLNCETLEIYGTVQSRKNTIYGNVFLIEDETAGMQILDKANNYPVGNQVYALGAMSTGQAKRLNATQTYHVGKSTVTASPTIKLQEAPNYLGRKVTIEGKVTKIDGDYVYLTQDQTELRLVYTDAKTVFQLNDVVRVEVLLDYSSSAHQNQAWYDEGVVDISRSLVATTVPVVTTTSSGATTLTSTALPVTKSTSVKTALTSSSVQPAKATQVMVQSQKLDKIDDQTDDQGQNSQSKGNSYLELIVCGLAGLLAMGGSRFGRLFSA